MRQCKASEARDWHENCGCGCEAQAAGLREQYAGRMTQEVATQLQTNRWMMLVLEVSIQEKKVPDSIHPPIHPPIHPSTCACRSLPIPCPRACLSASK